jgi:ribosomal protein S12 methylthiotransferase
VTKIGFISLGCPKNLVDSEVMMGLVQEAGHTLTSDAGSADVLVVNTCAFIEGAKQESIDTILEMAEHRRSGRCRRLVVTGCLAERYRAELKAAIPDIDVTLGTGEVPRIVEALDAPTSARPTNGVPVRFFRRTPETVLEPSTTRPTYLYDACTPRTLSTPGHYAYLKVAEGCDYACSFCIIPTLRGAYRSRTADSILEEARALAGRGVRELILVSQDTTFFGNELGERGGLARLLRALDRVEGLEWIRLLYLYPTTVSNDVLAAMAECEKICKYVDLPLQHASSPVLRRMRRPGDRRSYAALLANIRRRVPGVTLRTTFIVGFPGETDADFEELSRFVRETRFDHVGVFTYSHEEGTAAFGLPDDVPASTKRRRRRDLMAVQRRIAAAAQRARIGQILDLRIDGTADADGLVLQGRTAGQAPEIDPVVYLDECDPSRYRAGQRLRARVTGARGYDLIAAPLA